MVWEPDLMIFHDFPMKNIFFHPRTTYTDAEFHGEFIFYGFRTIGESYVGEKLGKPKFSSIFQISGHPPPNGIRIYPGPHCSTCRCRILSGPGYEQKP